MNPYRTPGAGDPDAPMPPLEAPAIGELLTNAASLPFWYLPCHEVPDARGDVQITVCPQRVFRVRGMLFDPACAPHVSLLDLNVGYYSLFPTQAPIAGALLTIDPRQPIAAQVQMAARFEGTVANPGVPVGIRVRAHERCTLRSVVLVEPYPECDRKVREIDGAYSDAVASELTRRAQRIKDLEDELVRLKAPTVPEYEGAWMTPTDES